MTNAYSKLSLGGKKKMYIVEGLIHTLSVENNNRI